MQSCVLLIGGQRGTLKSTRRACRQPKVRGIADCDAIAIRRVHAFTDFDFGLGNKSVGILLAGEGFDMALAGLAGVVAKPSMALFAGRCFPCAFLTDIISPYTLAVRAPALAACLAQGCPPKPPCLKT